MRNILTRLWLLLVGTIYAAAALAGEQPQVNGVDLAPLVNIGIQVVAAVLGMIFIPIVIDIIGLVRQKLGLAKIAVNQAEQEQYEAIWRKMIGYAVNATEGMTAQAAASGSFMVTTRSPFMDNAIRYGLSHFNESLRKAEVIKTDGAVDRDKLAAILNSRLGLIAMSSSVGQPVAVASSPDATKVTGNTNPS